MALGAKKIFLLWNNETTASALVQRLLESGSIPTVIRDPLSALSELARIHPDLVIVDVSTPEQGGFAFIEKLRRNTNPAIQRTPVIIASQSGDLMEISQALQSGIQDYFVTSTSSVDQILEKINKQFPDTSSQGIASTAESPVNAPVANIPKLLIVEDDKFLRDLATQKLSKEHLRVFAAVDGEQGLALAEKEIPDIILLDILLPGIDGFEVLRRIRLNSALGETHIAMLSNFGQREDVERALRTGADQFFVKANYTLDEIVDEVKKIMAMPKRTAPVEAVAST